MLVLCKQASPGFASNLANLKHCIYSAWMLSREILPLLTKRLDQFDSVALLALTLFDKPGRG